MELALYLLLEKGICVVPGSAYGQSTEKFLRISIGAESEERIDHALQIIYDFINSNPVNSADIHQELKRLGLPEFSTRKTHVQSTVDIIE